MKMSKELYAQLSDAVKAEDNENMRAAYRLQKLSSERYRWDLFWYAASKSFDINQLYNADLKDSHINTALRKIVPDL